MSNEGNSALAGSSLPAEGFVRIAQIVGDPPRVPAIIPVSRSHLLRMVRTGAFPPPIKVAPRLAMWPVAAVRAWMAEQAKEQS